MLVYPIRVFPNDGGGGSGAAVKYLLVLHSRRKSAISVLPNADSSVKKEGIIARIVQTYLGSRSNSHGLENPLTRWWVSFSGSGELVPR